MKRFATTIVTLLFAISVTAQKQQLYKQVFNDSVMGTIFAPPLWTSVPQAYKLLAHTDAWAHKRFYFQAPGPNDYPEAMNPYAYNDSVLAKRITKNEWNMLAHKALAQKASKMAQRPAKVTITQIDAIPNEGIFFSLTEPVFYKDWALIDLTYYQRDEERTSPEQCYQGQALFVFNKQYNSNWKLIRIVNNFIL